MVPVCIEDMKSDIIVGKYVLTICCCSVSLFGKFSPKGFTGGTGSTLSISSDPSPTELPANVETECD